MDVYAFYIALIYDNLIKMRKKSRRTNPCAAALIHNFSYKMLKSPENTTFSGLFIFDTSVSV